MKFKVEKHNLYGQRVLSCINSFNLVSSRMILLTVDSLVEKYYKFFFSLNINNNELDNLETFLSSGFQLDDLKMNC